MLKEQAIANHLPLAIDEILKDYHLSRFSAKDPFCPRTSPAYGSDGDYWSMPNAETIFDAVYEMMNEVDSVKYPKFM